MPTQGIYSASKSAVSRYLESLRLEVYNSDIAVTELAPGCIDTDMNRDLEFRPFVTSLKRGARILADKIEAKVNFSHVTAWPWGLITRIVRILPNKLLALKKRETLSVKELCVKAMAAPVAGQYEAAASMGAEFVESNQQ